jgi:starch phosphorylase
MADYESYIETQHKAETQYSDRKLWTKKSIINSSRMGRFSSDRTIKEYAEDIWRIKPIKIE